MPDVLIVCTGYVSVIEVRAVHGSVRVRFVPNPEPTRPDRVSKTWTRSRPAEGSGSGGRMSSGSSRVLVGFRLCEW